MKQKAGFVIDKITNSIEDVTSGAVFETDILPITEKEVKTILKKDGWLFNWRREFIQPNHQVLKLIIRNEVKLQGIVSFEPQDGYVEVYLLENAPHNLGQKKQYSGVAGNLVVFVCKTSYDLGFDGCIAFTAKTRLVNHYRKSLGAELIYGNERMGIFEKSAKILVNSYFKDYIK